MAKYKVTLRLTGSDYEEVRSLFGFSVTRKGSTMEVTVDANDPETAKETIKQIVGSRANLLGASKY